MEWRKGPVAAAVKLRGLWLCVGKWESPGPAEVKYAGTGHTGSEESLSKGLEQYGSLQDVGGQCVAQ